ncbi:MAG TPA: 7-carboxy-7-deazaguanine synthase QueE [Fimbriimonas sp.]|nr:7-carboxy-7-deazaguanine synthase QueE [Fimbriimonas sp.]
MLISEAGKLRIAEVFSSLQGEGIWAGVPSTFIRISGCNLRCSWCDTPYASWRPEGPLRTVEEIVGEVAERRPRHAVITGGEPMLFEQSVALAQSLRAIGFTITVETAGTVYRQIPCDLMSISPKLSNSTPDTPPWEMTHEQRRVNLDALSRLITQYPHQIKFVVDPERGDDLPEIDDLLSKLPPVAPERILLMPEGRDAEALWRKGRLLVNVCIERGWRLAPRMQIDLFGDTRGT